jgi:cytochrome c biogenesis protein
LTGSKQIIYEDLALNDVPESGKLTNSNFSYRAQMLLREGEKQSVAVLKAKEGYFIQDLPFIVGLNDFRIEHYSTGQPKSFESDLIVEDKETGELIKKTINVNTPLTFNGVTINHHSKMVDRNWRLMSGIYIQLKRRRKWKVLFLKKMS